MRLKLIGGLLFLTLAASAAAQQTTPPAKDAKDDQSNAANAAKTYVRPTAKERRKDFVDSIVGPWALARTVAGAGFSTWRNSPAEWGGRWEGFGRRVASNFGRNAIRQTIVYGLDESLRLDSKFYRSPKRSFGAKLKNALLSPVTARTASGRRVFGLPRVAGTYASSIIAYEAWYPKRFNYKNGLRSGTISLGLNAAVNLIKELIKK